LGSRRTSWLSFRFFFFAAIHSLHVCKSVTICIYIQYKNESIDEACCEPLHRKMHPSPRPRWPQKGLVAMASESFLSDWPAVISMKEIPPEAGSSL
jgi:hypothetical protein